MFQCHSWFDTLCKKVIYKSQPCDWECSRGSIDSSLKVFQGHLHPTRTHIQEPKAGNLSFCYTISAGEVLGAVWKMTRASGPDGIKRYDLLWWNQKGEKSADLFNAILYSGNLPKCLKESRTTLIPKSYDQQRLSDLNQWWLITSHSEDLLGCLDQKVDWSLPGA